MQYPTEIKTENLICFAGFKEQKITVNPKIDPVRFYNHFRNFRLDEIRTHVIIYCHANCHAIFFWSFSVDCSQSPIFSLDRLDIHVARLTVNNGHLQSATK